MHRTRIGRFHVLTDFYFQQAYTHAELARLAIQGGADTIQFRQKFGGIRHRLYEAKRLEKVCRRYDVPVLVNDTIEIALRIGADGVHLGQNDFPIDDARAILPPGAIVGATASTTDEAVRAWHAGADYIGFGPVFPTGSKANPTAVRGLAALRAVCAAIDIPVIAIAGITADRIAAVIDSGAHGVAVMTAVTTASDPAAAAGRIRVALDEALR